MCKQGVKRLTQIRTQKVCVEAVAHNRQNYIYSHSQPVDIHARWPWALTWLTSKQHWISASTSLRHRLPVIKSLRLAASVSGVFPRSLNHCPLAAVAKACAKVASFRKSRTVTMTPSACTHTRVMPDQSLHSALSTPYRYTPHCMQASTVCQHCAHSSKSDVYKQPRPLLNRVTA